MFKNDPLSNNLHNLKDQRSGQNDGKVYRRHSLVELERRTTSGRVELRRMWLHEGEIFEMR